MIHKFFHKPSDENEIIDFINDFSLHLRLENDRTKIYESNQMRGSIDSSVIRVLIFQETNTQLVEGLDKYLYKNT